jgi:hypothetical protein
MNGEFLPWQNHDDHKEAVRRREMMLPLQYRMAGNMRWFRDALLASMLLAPQFAPITTDFEQLAFRENRRTEMVARANFLKQMMTDEQISKATEAAKDLFSREILKAKDKALGNKPTPRFASKKHRRR